VICSAWNTPLGGFLQWYEEWCNIHTHTAR
jgi:hypothetical protein